MNGDQQMKYGNVMENVFNLNEGLWENWALQANSGFVECDFRPSNLAPE